MSQTQRTIHLARDQWHLAWDHSIAPLAQVSSGDTISFDLLDASCGQITPDATVATIGALDFSRVDQVNGPIFVEGAHPGDTLEIEFLELQPAEWGWTALIPGFGLLADEFPDPALKLWRLRDGRAEFASGIQIPLEPFCGEIGLAPAAPGAFSTIPPYRHGGNLDTRHLTRGAKLYLPVEVEGALFSMGDGHAAQGDGEVDQTAIETSLCGRLQLTVRKDMKLIWPRAETPTDYISMATDPELLIATKTAIQEMVDFIVAQKHLSRHEAYQLVSIAGNVAVTQLVDKPNVGVHVRLPKSIFVEKR